MTDCLFCKIAAGSIPVKEVHADDVALAFADINPQAPVHLLVIPREHFADITEVPAETLGHLLRVAAELGKEHAAGGFRVVANTGPDGGQTVPHIHLHLLGGRHLGWPPG